MTRKGDSARERVRDMALCSYCPKMCRPVCPVGNAEARETTTTWGKMWQAFRVVDHGEPIDLGVSSVFDACTGCGACTTFCEHGVDVAGALYNMRELSHVAGASPRAETLADRYDTVGRSVEEELATRYSEEVDAPPAAVALLAGEAALRQRPGLTSLALRVLRDAGLEVGALPAAARKHEVGQRLLWAGLIERFDAHARMLGAALEPAATIICLDPEDAYFLSVVYPAREHRVAPRVTTVVEELARRLDRLPQRPGSRLAYHDPCYLGRRLGVYDAPRRVVEHVLTEPPLEFAWTREHSECAGGGGLYPEANPEGARRAARRRWDSRPAGAEGLVTACPRAEALLLSAGADVVDVVELVSGQRLAAPSADREGK